MSNNEFMEEATRIANELIKIENSDDDLHSLFIKFLKINYKKNALNVMLYLSRALAEKKYCISSTSPFKLEKM
ncbi:MAG: hypothetical protein J6B64_00660 [Bacilli bacterium]|nr:hypothetical protein [Bacilli bacterium]MBP3635386.1 hypothetical protein [Bacilli bacterium]